MSTESPDTTQVLAEISHGPSPFEEFLENNQKLIIIVAILIALGTAGYVVVSGIEKSKQETAGTALVSAVETAEIEAVIAEHAGTRAAQSAAILLANEQWNAGDKDQAIATLEGFLSANPDHSAAPTAKASLAAKWMSNGKSAEAVTAFNEIVDDPSAAYLAPYALLCIGDIAMAAGDASKAKDAYNRINAEFPDSSLITTATTRINNVDAAKPTTITPPAVEEAPVIEEEAPAPKAPAAVEETPAPASPEAPSTEEAPESPAKSDS